MKTMAPFKALCRPLVLPGLVFLGVNLTTSHMFYHVNSYKIFLLLLGLTGLAFRQLPFFPTGSVQRLPWKTGLILAAPLLATFPGLLQHRLAFNYNFRYELATDLALWFWVIYLVYSARDSSDLEDLCRFIGLAVIYAGIWSLLEKTGTHPLDWGAPPADMVKATFGHRNYFSGFLILLLPLLLMGAIPHDLFAGFRPPGRWSALFRTQGLYLAAFLLGSISLMLAQTRAAIAAGGASLMLAGYLFAYFFAPDLWRRRLVRLLAVILVALVVAAVGLFFWADSYPSSRFLQLFTLRAWLGRLLPWQAAIASIQSSPLFGYGLGSSYNLFFWFVDPDARLFHHEHSYNHAHSEILEYLQESGGLGLVIFLLFWGYIFLQLIKVLRHPQTKPRLRQLAIGVCCGLIAYHIHSVFSVAPRMLVMKLPLYTLLALVFILVKSPTAEKTGQTRMGSGFRFGLTMTGLLLAIWILYLPWALTQYHFVRIQRERPSLVQVEKLERLVRVSTDIYALDYLSRLQVEYQRPVQLQWTLDRIEQIIPHYRESGHTRAILALLRGDAVQAKGEALAFQQRDRYYLPTIDLLMGLAVTTNDPELFRRQFVLFLRKHLSDHQLVQTDEEYMQRFRHFLRTIVFGPAASGNPPPESVPITLTEMTQPVSIHDQQPQLRWYWDIKLIDQLFQTARRNRQAQTISLEEKQRYGTFLFQILNGQPYFQLTVHGTGEEQEAETIRESARRFYLARKNLETTRLRLNQEEAATLQHTTAPRERNDLQKRYALSRRQAEQDYDDQVAPLEEKLRQRTDWDRYQSKQQFLNQFVNRLIAIVFPNFQPG